MNAKETVMVAAALAFAVSVGVSIVEKMPDTAPVIANNVDRTYRSNQCVSNDEWGSNPKITAARAKQLGLKQNKECQEIGGFRYETRLLWHWLGATHNWN